MLKADQRQVGGQYAATAGCTACREDGCGGYGATGQRAAVGADARYGEAALPGLPLLVRRVRPAHATLPGLCRVRQPARVSVGVVTAAPRATAESAAGRIPGWRIDLSPPGRHVRPLSMSRCRHARAEPQPVTGPATLPRYRPSRDARRRYLVAASCFTGALGIRFTGRSGSSFRLSDREHARSMGTCRGLAQPSQRWPPHACRIGRTAMNC